MWDFSVWAGTIFKLDFVGGRNGLSADYLDSANADLLRLLMTWFMWGPRAVRSANTCKQYFLNLRRVFALCSRNSILASDLMRFPKVVQQLPDVISKSEYEHTIATFHRLWDAREQIGFTLVDPEGIKTLMELSPDHEKSQTAYIPPRIWTYQVNRLRECLDEFLHHRQMIEDCFGFCIEAYAKNWGSLELAMRRDEARRNTNLPPFQLRRKLIANREVSREHHGRFEQTAQRFGIKELLERWTQVPVGGLEIRQFSGYLSLVQYAGLAYITNFSLQRIEEAASLRADCLIWEDDKLGRIPIICGETTKTDSDSDARWPTSPSVQVAVDAMSTVARLRLRCALADSRIAPNSEDQVNYFLFSRAFEPWASAALGSYQPYSIRPKVLNYRRCMSQYPKLFDKEQLRITEDDLRIARMITPNLSEDRGFAVGQVWPLAWHQLRRTGAINMFASGLLSDSSIQFQMKHAHLLQSAYYGRGHTRLQFNEDAEAIVISTMYEVLAHQLLSATTERYVSPHGVQRKEGMIVNLIGDKDFKALIAAGRRGETSFREIRLGACTKLGDCEYGGIESVARCGGGDGNGPCADVLYDRNKLKSIEHELMKIDVLLEHVQAGSPRERALREEHSALESYLHVIRN